MAWDGKERRKRIVPATRRFVLCVAAVVIVYVSFVFWRVEVNGDRDLDRVDQQAQKQYENDVNSCQRGDDIRRALVKLGVGTGLTLGTCLDKVKSP